MQAPALMSPAETERYAKWISYLASISRGATQEYYANAAKALRIQADFGGGDEHQRRYAR